MAESKDKDDWMGFYSGKIPRRAIKKKKPAKKAPKKTNKYSKEYKCWLCTNTSKGGAGKFVKFDVLGKLSRNWTCSPCISRYELKPDSDQSEPPSALVPKGTSLSKSVSSLPQVLRDDDWQNDDDEDDEPFDQLSHDEILQMEKRQKDRNFWAIIVGIITIAIMLSLVERSRLFSVVAVMALVAVFLLYKYEVK